MSGECPSLLIRGQAGLERLRRRAGSADFAGAAGAVIAEAEGLLRAEPVCLPAVPDPITPDTPRTGEIGCARDAQHRMVTLALAYLLTGRRKFVDRTVREMRFAVERWDRWVDWAHRPLTCDLMTATVACGMALAFDWLAGAMNADDREAIVAGLEARALRTYLADIAGKPGWSVYRGWGGVSPVNNWNAWINGGIGLAALATLELSDRAAEALATARENIRLYTSYLHEDGANEEGSGYWAVGLRYCCLFFDALRTRLGSDDGFFDLPAVRATGYFPIWLSPTGVPMSFGDAVSTGADPVVHYLLADRHGLADLAWYADTVGRSADSPWALLFHPHGNQPDFARWPRCHLWKTINWAFVCDRWPDPSVYLSFKNGDLNASHTQLDLNSFQLYAFGEKLAVDLGAPHYTRKYFSPARWEIYPAQTQAHNAVLIDGAGQMPRSVGRIEQFRVQPGRAGLVGLADTAYGPHVRRVRRHVVFLRDRYFVILDEVAADRPVTLAWRLHTFGAIRAGDGWADVLGRKANIRVLWDAAAVAGAVLDNPGNWNPSEQVLELAGRSPQEDWLLATVLYPSPGQSPANVELKTDRSGDTLLIRVKHAELTDVVEFVRCDDGWRRT